MSDLNQNYVNGYRPEMVPTQTIITGSFVKYTRLQEIVLQAFRGSSATEINIYIDLYGIIKTLFSDSLRTDISDYTAMTSTIINMCGHYRAFFKSIGVYAKIFLVFGYNCPEMNQKFVQGYNNQFASKVNNKMIREMVDLNNALLEVLCPYLPEIHFIKTSFESSVMIEFLIQKEEELGNKNPNIIISKDIYPCQITCLHDNTAYIKPKKLRSEDLSGIIVPRNNPYFIDSFWSLYSSVRSCDRNHLYIHPINFPLLAAMTRFPERNLRSITTMQRASRLIYTAIGPGPTKLTPMVLGNCVMEKIPLMEIESRFKALDVEFQTRIFKDSIESKTIHYENLTDVGTVNNICAKYFERNPIDLQKL